MLEHKKIKIIVNIFSFVAYKNYYLLLVLQTMKFKFAVQ